MDIAEVFGAAGPLARQISGFAPRVQQQRMAEAVTHTLDERGVLVAEAGTGTGKTFAYLVPALLSGLRIILSTGTRNLQDQLYHRDLPLIREVLASPVQAALLKGRSNYLCLQRLEQAIAAGHHERRRTAELQRLQSWSRRTRSGDISETDLPEDSSLWPQVTSTAENCLGSECPHYQDCFLVKARHRAMEAQLLVVNHHLFFADMVVKEEGFGEMLPGADAFILDEAHQLPEIASHFFGLSLSSRQLTELARDSQVEQCRDAPDSQIIGDLAQELETAVAAFRLALGELPRREPWLQMSGDEEAMAALERLRAALQALIAGLEAIAERGKGLESCQQRAIMLAERLARLTANEEEEGTVRWFETQRRSFILSLTPLDVAAAFRDRMASYRSAWIFTSATLAVESDFRHFNQQLGLAPTASLCLASPFDFSRHALLYHPHGIPDPQVPDFVAAVVTAVIPVLEASRGRAFVLFTSHRALREAADLLQDRLPYPLLVQGQASTRELLAQFRTLGNAILLGTGSFWEGVDVRGEALSCVVIAKLPFAAPTDPILAARIATLRRQGANPFYDYQLPQAVINLKQGVGRLIRDVQDRGVLVLCDPRLSTKSYGQIFLDSLPPMTRTRKLSRVQRFFSVAALSAGEVS